MSVDRTLLISAAAALVSAGLLGGCNRNENAGKATGISGTSAVEDGGGDGISSGAVALAPAPRARGVMNRPTIRAPTSRPRTTARASRDRRGR